MEISHFKLIIFIKLAFIPIEFADDTHECFSAIDYCGISCDGINGKHTLCDKAPEKSGSCGSFVLKHKKHLYGFVHAHNALRDRIASRAKFGGMVELQEDSILTNMAENWLKQCKETKIDNCANYNVISFDEQVEEYKGVSQNVAYIRSKYFPPYIKYYVLRKWYSEKLRMDIPKYNFTYENPFVTWTEANLSNNFSHLAYPHTSKIGCALGGYRGGFAIVCNYYQFLLNAKMHYGAGATLCPNSFPLRSLKYKNLCTSVSRAAHINSKVYHLAIFAIFVIFFLNMFTNVKLKQYNIKV